MKLSLSTAVNRRLPRALGLLTLMAAVSPALAQPFAEFGRRVQEFRLANGVRFALLERHAAPGIAVHVRIQAGIADEGEGQRNAAVMLSRIFIHGSESLGTRNLAQEKQLMQTAERHGDEVAKEAARGEKANVLLSQDADIRARIAREEALRQGQPFFFRDAFAAQAIQGATASAGPDAFLLAGAASSTRAEFLFKAFGEWVRKPGARAYYHERRTFEEILDRDKPGVPEMLQRGLLAAAFWDQPYGRLRPDQEALKLLRPGQVEAFAAARFVPENVAVGVSGDITLAETRRLAELYFGKMLPEKPTAQAAPEARKIEAEKRIEIPTDNPELLAFAWYRPPRTHADAVLLELTHALLSSGPSSLLHKETMGANRIARHVRVLSSFPGDRFQNLFVIESSPAVGHAAAEVEKAIDTVLERLRTTPPAAEDLARAKAAIRRQFAAGLDSNAGVAAAIARFTLDFGSVAAIGQALERVEKVTPEDIRRIAAQWLPAKSRFAVRVGSPWVYVSEAPQ